MIDVNVSGDPLDLVVPVWNRLVRAVREAGDPWRTPVVATAGPDGSGARVVVLRAADPESGTLEFHTDGRSPKIADLRHDPRTAWVFHDPVLGVQVRAEGTSEVLTEGPRVGAAWERVPGASRINYVLPLAPGTPIGAPAREAGLLPADRHHFAMVVTRVERWDWLWLAPGGPCRAGFVRGGAGWTGAWRVP